MDAVARVAIPLLEYAPITQNSLRTGVPNLRVGSDEGSRAYSLEIANDRDNLDTVIESAYRQIFFHAFKTDRDVNLESQLKDGQITVRDFIRGLTLSRRFNARSTASTAITKLFATCASASSAARSMAKARNSPGRS